MKNRSATISRVLVGEQSQRGKGCGREMMLEILRIGFDELKLHRIDLIVFDFNAQAIKCYQRVGFVVEGILREYRRYNDVYWNSVIMSMLDYEWEEMKEKIKIKKRGG